jgi:transposase
MLRLYEDGMTAPEIARRVGRGESSVYRVLHAAGLKPSTFERQRQRARVLTDEQEFELVRLNREGMWRTDLVRHFGVTLNTVLAVLQRRGEDPTARHGVRAQRDPGVISDIAARWQAGEAQASIAASHGISQWTVLKILRASGLNPPIIRRPRVGYGVSVTSGGYRKVKLPADHPFASMRDNKGYALEHRIVMAQKLGRPLGRYETVHHIDGNKLNNSPENLQLRQGQHGKGMVMRCLDCGSSNVGCVPLDAGTG